MSNNSDRKVLKVTVDPVASVADLERELDEVGETIAAALDGERPPAHPYRVTFDSLETLNRVLSDTNLRLLEAVAAHEPASIRELARRVDRDVRRVHDNVTLLESWGFLELVEDGHAKRPVIWYDELEISVPLSRDHESRPDRASA